MDLTTEYLGMKLRTPLVPSASPLSDEFDNIKRMEDAGASAVVLSSLFEEQLLLDRYELHHHLTHGAESFAEALTYIPEPGGIRLGAEDYLERIRKAKEAVAIPIIASLNGVSVGGWTDYANLIQEAGADALELNIYYIPTDPTLTGAEVEQTYLDILAIVKSLVTIPVAVKLSPFFSNLANMARRLDEAGADALVLFNRFYQPDIDLDNLVVRPNVILSTPQALAAPATLDRDPLRPHQRRSGGHERHPHGAGRDQDAHGRRQRHHALLRPAAARHQPHPLDRAGSAPVDGRARIRIGRADEGQHEPDPLRESGEFERAQYLRALQSFKLVVV